MSCKSLKEDLEKGFRFWKAVKIIFGVLSEEPNTINDDLKQMFPLADQMLRIKVCKKISKIVEFICSANANTRIGYSALRSQGNPSMSH